MSQRSLEELFREGIKSAAKPYVAAAIEHRDAMPTPLPVQRVRRARSFARSRVIATVATAASLTGAVAYAAPAVLHSARSNDPNQVRVASQGSTAANDSASRATQGSGTPVSNTPDTKAATGPGVTSATNPSSHPSGVAPNSGVPPTTMDPHLAVVYDDGGLHVPASLPEGVVEIGFQDARSNPTGPLALNVSLMNASIEAGTSTRLHFDIVNVPYVFSVSGATTARTAVVSAFAANEAAPNADNNIAVTLDGGGFTFPNRGSANHDEPYWQGDEVPPPDAVWTTYALRSAQDRPYIRFQNNTTTSYTLTINGRHWAGGDVAGGASPHFQLPLRNDTYAPYGKWVLTFTGTDGSIRRFTVWPVG